MRVLGIEPKVAMVSHSNFGSQSTKSSRKMRDALAIVMDRDPKLEIDGEMQTDAAIMEDIRYRLFPKSRLRGEANLLVMPSMDAASITFNALKALGNGVSVGPLLLGMDKPAHILSRTVTTRGVVNLSTVAALDAQVFGQMESNGKGSKAE